MPDSWTLSNVERNWRIWSDWQTHWKISKVRYLQNWYHFNHRINLNLHRIGLSTYKSSREESYSDFSRSMKDDFCLKSEDCQKSHPDIRCSTCWNHVTTQNVTFLNNITTPHAKSVHNMSLFGEENILIQEFVNPHNYHFQSFQVSRWLSFRNQRIYSWWFQLQVSDAFVKTDEKEEWNGGDTWFPGNIEKSVDLILRIYFGTVKVISSVIWNRKNCNNGFMI